MRAKVSFFFLNPCYPALDCGSLVVFGGTLTQSLTPCTRQSAHTDPALSLLPLPSSLPAVEEEAHEAPQA